MSNTSARESARRAGKRRAARAPSKSSRGGAGHEVAPGARSLPRGLGPLVVAVLAGLLGHAPAERSDVFAAAAPSSKSEVLALEAAPALAAANATWAFGSVSAVKAMVLLELDRLPDGDPERARALLRLGIIDANPDGQAAAFAAACAADPRLCERPKEAVEREVRARFVPPGNTLPAFFGGGHAAITQ